jgi:hypothetical protein
VQYLLVEHHVALDGPIEDLKLVLGRQVSIEEEVADLQVGAVLG